jgi:hypothetical protein
MVCILKTLRQSYSEAAYQAQLQLQRTEFVPVRSGSELSAAAKMNAAEVRHETIIPSKLNGKS